MIDHLGMKVIPLLDKKPIEKGFAKKDYEAATLTKHVKDGGALGRIIPDGFVVIDLDPRNGGWESWPEVVRKLGGTPVDQTYCVRSGGGGLHAYYRYTNPKQLDTLKKIVQGLKGIDLKTPGTTITAPGSQYDGGEKYEQVARGTPVAPLPIQTPLGQKKEENVDLPAGCVSLEAVAEMLELIAPDQFNSYDDWRNLIFATNHATDGDLEALAMLMAWSASDPTYGSKGSNDCEQVWNRMGSYKGAPITASYLRQALRRSGKTAGLLYDETDKHYTSDNVKLKSKLMEFIKLEELDPFKAEIFLEEILVAENVKRALANRLIKSMKKERKTKVKNLQEDESIVLADLCLDKYFNYGRNLIASDDGRYKQFVGTHWGSVSGEDLGQYLYLEYERGRFEGTARDLVSRAQHRIRHRQRRHESPFMKTTTGDITPMWVCRNVVVELAQDGIELRKHDQDDWGTHVLNVEYDPAAASPRFDKFLREITLGDEELAQYVLECVAYMTQTTRSMACWWLWVGSGSNGKSTLSRILLEMLGDFSCPGSLVELQKDTFGLSMVDGKLLFVDDDIPTGVRLPDGTIKKLSERKALMANRKHVDHYMMISRAVVLLMGNSYPKIQDLSYGLRRRMNVVPFDLRVKQPDPHLAERLIAHELPGILNRLVEAGQALFRRGKFAPPKRARDAKLEAMSGSSDLAGFLVPNLPDELTEDTRVELVEKYKVWLLEQGLERAPSVRSMLTKAKELIGG